jgi:hypothetical protein
VSARQFIADFAHNCVAHPLMFFTRNAAWSVRFHDWTAGIAWPN